MKADVLVIFSSYEFPFKMRIVVTHFIPILSIFILVEKFIFRHFRA